MSDLVLVTGATGFVGMHCIVRLLRDDYRVMATLRSKARSKQGLDGVRGELGSEAGPLLERLSLREADLWHDQGWAEAVAGCRYALHVASPVPKTPPENADEIIRPAREGTLRVLQ